MTTSLSEQLKLLQFRVNDCAVYAKTPLKQDTGRPATLLVGCTAGRDLSDPTPFLVQVSHLPTGMVETETRFSPYRNKELCLERLKQRVEEAYEPIRKKLIEKDKEEQGAKEDEGTL